MVGKYVGKGELGVIVGDDGSIEGLYVGEDGMTVGIIDGTIWTHIAPMYTSFKALSRVGDSTCLHCKTGSATRKIGKQPVVVGVNVVWTVAVYVLPLQKPHVLP